MTRRIRLIVLGVGIVAFAVSMALAFTGMPQFGGDLHAYRDAAVAPPTRMTPQTPFRASTSTSAASTPSGKRRSCSAPSSASRRC
jgi:hypothetical protein